MILFDMLLLAQWKCHITGPSHSKSLLAVPKSMLCHPQQSVAPLPAMLSPEKGTYPLESKLKMVPNEMVCLFVF